jgi:hypothetical protein
MAYLGNPHGVRSILLDLYGRIPELRPLLDWQVQGPPKLVLPLDQVRRLRRHRRRSGRRRGRGHAHRYRCAPTPLLHSPHPGPAIHTPSSGLGIPALAIGLPIYGAYKLAS